MPPLLDQPGVHKARTQLVLRLRYIPHLFSVFPSHMCQVHHYITMQLYSQNSTKLDYQINKTLLNRYLSFYNYLRNIAQSDYLLILSTVYLRTYLITTCPSSLYMYFISQLLQISDDNCIPTILFSKSAARTISTTSLWLFLLAR